MMVNQEQIQSIVNISKELYDHIRVPSITDQAPYRGRTMENQFFELDNVGYDVWYASLLSNLLTIPKIAEMWSEDGIQREVDHFLANLATLKNQTTRGSPPVDFVPVSIDLLNRVNIDFDDIEAFIPIIGLAVDKPLEIGQTIFWPLMTKKDELGTKIHARFFNDLYPFRDSIASTSVRSEAFRSVEILRIRAESSLNIVRFISSLIWQNEPQRYIYVAGRDPRRVSYASAIDNKDQVYQMSNSIRNPLPIHLDSQTLQLANFWGLDHLRSLLKVDQTSPLVRNMFTAIEWFGDAMRDFSPAYSFVKYYISLEATMKRMNETARKVLPERISTLLEPLDVERRERLEKTITTIVKERNEVFHEGKPKDESIEYLNWACRHIARNTIHRLRELIASKNLETKDALADYLSSYRTH